MDTFKKIIALFIVSTCILSLVSCGQNTPNDPVMIVDTPGRDPHDISLTPDPEGTVKPADTQMPSEPSPEIIDSTPTSDPTMENDGEHFTVIKQLTGIRIPRGEIDYMDGSSKSIIAVKETIRESIISISDQWCGSVRGIAAGRYDGKSGLFAGAIRTIAPIGHTVFSLPDPLSENLRLFNTEDWVEFTDCGFAGEDQAGELPARSSGILFDDTNDIVISFTIDEQNLHLKKAVQLSKGYSLADYRIEVGYQADGINKAIVTSKKNHTVYIINTDTLECLEKKGMVEWETLAACKEKNLLLDSRILSLYQINRSQNIIRQYDLSGEKTAREFHMNHSPIKGQVIDMYSDMEGDLVFVVTPGVDTTHTMYLFDSMNEKLYEIAPKNPDLLEEYAAIERIDNIYFYQYDYPEYGYSSKSINIFPDPNTLINIWLDHEDDFNELNYSPEMLIKAE